MADENKKNPPKDLTRFFDRIGAALLAPPLAFALSDSKAGQGRASGDVTLFLLMVLFAVENALFASAGWMLWDGDYSGALTVLMVGLRDRLVMPIFLLLGGAILVWLGMGRRRSFSRDFDLACVALVPLVFAELLNGALSLASINIRQPLVWLGYSAYIAWLLWAVIFSRKERRDVSGPVEQGP